MTNVLQARALRKTYTESSNSIDILRGVDLDVAQGEMLAIIGASGSGKSTLLHILGLLDLPDTGELNLAGQNAIGLNETSRSQMRNQYLGFVYQFHHLLPEFSALDNVAMPLIVRNNQRKQAREQAATILERVGLAQRIQHFPSQLSGGERQRVALARALVSQPVCVLADEPTGNLDRNTADSIYQLFCEINRDLGTAFVIVTHDQQLAQRADRTINMVDGQLLPC